MIEKLIEKTPFYEKKFKLHSDKMTKNSCIFLPDFHRAKTHIKIVDRNKFTKSKDSAGITSNKEQVQRENSCLRKKLELLSSDIFFKK
jgi:hypothetical protein